jgi:predicted TIM-barrel fold metal-dependent hydrolase
VTMYVDIHGHLSPPGDGGPPSLRDPEAMIDRKRALGIGMTVIGSPVGAGMMLPVPGVDNYAQTADQVKAHNELMAGLVDQYPDSLRTYAYLDPLGDEAMLGQAKDLMSDPRFVGLVVNSSINDQYLDTPKAEQFFAMAAEARVPVLLHAPARPVGAGSLGDFAMIEHVGRFNDITAGLAAILRAGWLERFPDLVLVAAAGGGAIAQLLEKLDLAADPNRPGPPPGKGPKPAADRLRPDLGTPPSAAARRLYVDTSCPNAHQIDANLSVLGVDHVLFGTDAPPMVEVLEPIVGLVSEAVLTAADRERVCWRNAADLYGIEIDESVATA